MFNIAICGAGRAGTFLHFNVYKKLQNCNVIALVDPNKELVQQKAAELQIPHYFKSIDELIKAEIKIDVVSVCTNLASHFDVAKKSVMAGFNVLVEKPATQNDVDLDELYTLADQVGVTVSVVHNHKYYPSLVRLRDLVKSNKLGNVVHIDRVMTFDRNSVRMMEPDHWSHNLPGGRLFEANPHNLYLIYGIVGEVELVNIEPVLAPNYFPHTAISGFNCLFKGKNCTVHLTMSLNCDSQGSGSHAPSYFLVTFENGAVYCDNGEFRVVKSTVAIKIRNVISEALNKLRAKFIATEAIGKGSGHYWFIKEFIESISNKSESPSPHSEARFTQFMNSKMGHEIDILLKSK